MEFNHIPVLFHETIDSLQIKPDGVYIDGTAGGGGHSQAILDRLTTGTLLSIDRKCNHIRVLLDMRQNPLAFLVADLRFLQLTRLIRRFFIRHLHDLQTAVTPQPLAVLRDRRLQIFFLNFSYCH